MCALFWNQQQQQHKTNAQNEIQRFFRFNCDLWIGGLQPGIARQEEYVSQINFEVKFRKFAQFWKHMCVAKAYAND